jgi:hypothetical protein
MKAWQKVIREKQSAVDKGGLFGIPDVDISKAVCREITYGQAKSIIEEYEWLGTMGTTQYHYGIFFENMLAGAICFGYFQAMLGYSNYVGRDYAKSGIQLSRGACVHWAHPHSASKLIAYGLKQMQLKGYKYVIAFSDSRAGEIGTVYQASNWIYLGIERQNRKHLNLYSAVSGKKVMDCRDFCKRYGYKNYNAYLLEHPEIKALPEPNKARYIYLLGSHKDKKEMLKNLSRKIKPYPKREV